MQVWTTRGTVGLATGVIASMSLGCVIVQIPENAGLDYTGHGWTCDKGYRQQGMSASGFKIRQMRVWTTRDTVGLATGLSPLRGTNVHREGASTR